jgi:hypothetical protein
VPFRTRATWVAPIHSHATDWRLCGSSRLLKAKPQARFILAKQFRGSLRFEPKCDLRIAQGVWGSVWTGSSKRFEGIRRSVRTPIRRVSSEPPLTAYNGYVVTTPMVNILISGFATAKKEARLAAVKRAGLKVGHLEGGKRERSKPQPPYSDYTRAAMTHASHSPNRNCFRQHGLPPRRAPVATLLLLLVSGLPLAPRNRCWRV